MAVLALLGDVQGLTEQFAAPGGPAVRATGLARATALAWAFGESLRYRLMMRRRARLGLADPVVANRFLLWCMWTGGLLGANAVIVIFRFTVGDLEQASAALHTAIVLCVTGLALGGGLSLWLAFFPPPAYILRVRARVA